MFQKTKSILLKTESILLALVLIASLLFISPTASANELAAMSDEFDGDLSGWTELNDAEPDVGPDRYDFLRVENGKMVAVLNEASTWYQQKEGSFVFKEVAGDFIATTHVKVSNANGTGQPSGDYTLGGMMARQANSNSWLFHAIGEGAGGGGYDTEVKTTVNASSQLELAASSYDNMEIALVRIGSDFAFLHRFPGENWAMVKRYNRSDLPGAVQVGMHFYNHYSATTSLNVSDYQNTDNIPSNANGFRAEYDYFRFKETGTDAAMNTLSDADLIALIEGEPKTTDLTIDPTKDPTTDPVKDPTTTDPVKDDSKIYNFEDLDESHWAWDHIKNMVDGGIMGGKNNVTFDAVSSATRAEATKVVAGALNLKIENCGENPFSDVVKGQDWFYDYAVCAANKYGFISGYNDGTFRGNEPISRYEFVALMVKAFEYQSQATSKAAASMFSDVSSDHWAVGALSFMTSKNIIEGFSDGTFRGDYSIDRAAMAKITDLMIKLP